MEIPYSTFHLKLSALTTIFEFLNLNFTDSACDLHGARAPAPLALSLTHVITDTLFCT